MSGGEPSVRPLTIGKPSIDLRVEAGDWPAAAALRSLAGNAVSAATAAVAEARPHTARPRRSQPALRQRECAALSILFTNDAAMRGLNRQWRGKDAATNVLSFPQPVGPLLGDVILAAETVRKEAALAGMRLEDHIAHLVVHGFLHLLGYDHQVDAEAEKMEELERVALNRLGISDPYARPQDP